MTHRPPPHTLDLPAPSQPRKALTHVSVQGVTWHLHEGVTPKGKARYFVARAVGVGALDAMPEGWEFRESVNGVVSVARIDPTAHAAPADLAALQAEVARHRHLARHKVFDVKGTLVLHEPDGIDPNHLSALASVLSATVLAARRFATRKGRFGQLRGGQRRLGGCVSRGVPRWSPGS